jgi:hypothetical protein
MSKPKTVIKAKNGTRRVTVIENTAQRKRKNKVKKPKTARVQTTGGKEVLVHRIPHCSVDYGNALADPFDTPGGVCLPFGDFPFRSQKVKAFIRSRFALGTSGFGYAAVLPTIVNDVSTVVVTGATSVGTNATIFSAYTNLTGLLNAQLPYTAANITNNQVQGRIVACGLRIKYVGSLADRNGTVVGFEDPDHRNAQTGYNFDTLSTNPCSMMERIGGDDWDMTVCYSGPSDPAHIEFLNSTTPLNNSIFMIAAVSGAAGDVYETEYYSHIEYIGGIVVAKTASHSDPNAIQIAMAAKAQAVDKPLQPESLPSMWDTVKSGLREIAPVVAQVGSSLWGSLKGDPNSSVSSLSPSGMLGMGLNAILSPANGFVNMPNHNPLMIEGVQSFSPLMRNPAPLRSYQYRDQPRQRQNEVVLR